MKRHKWITWFTVAAAITLFTPQTAFAQQDNGVGQQAAEADPNGPSAEYPLRGVLPQVHLELLNTAEHGVEFVETFRFTNTADQVTEWSKYNNSIRGDREIFEQVVARLSGRTDCIIPRDQMYLFLFMDYDKLDQESQVIRDFLNSFDWRNASDVEKVTEANKVIVRAAYQLADDNSVYNDVYRSYGCLVNRLCVCSGYTRAFFELTRCMGMECMCFENPSIDHAYNYIKIDGKWYEYDGTVASQMTSYCMRECQIDNITDTGFPKVRYASGESSMLVISAE